MTEHAHHHHAHGRHHGTHSHAAPGEGLVDAVISNAQGLASLGRKLGGGRDFWIGAAIGAVVAAVVNSPETRAALASVFRGSSPAPAPSAQNGTSVDVQSGG